jgi:hypothetical protein
VTTVYIGLDGGHDSVAEAEHWLRAVVGDLALPPEHGIVACTHLCREPRPHVAASLAVPGGVPERALPAVPAELAGAAETARREHETGVAGRAVLFPGHDQLTGELTVEHLLAVSAIERVIVLGGGPQPEPGTVVDTRDHVRPQWLHGRLTLVAMPSAGGRIAPFEVPDPTPCCADHA